MRKYKEIIMQNIFLLAALATIVALLLICFFLFANGLPAIMGIGFKGFLLNTDWSPNDYLLLMGSSL